MADGAAKKSAEKTEATAKEKTLVFKCKFCGESYPLSDLMVIKHYYPQVSVCKICARGVVDHEKSE